AVAATGHALPALGAGLAVGPRTTEVGVAHGLAGRRAVARAVLAVTETHTHGGQLEGVAHAHLPGDGAQVLVGGGEGGVGAHAQHAAGLVVEGFQFRLPVGDVAPLRVLEEGVHGVVERVRVVEGAAADPGP